MVGLILKGRGEGKTGKEQAAVEAIKEKEVKYPLHTQVPSCRRIWKRFTESAWRLDHLPTRKQ